MEKLSLQKVVLVTYESWPFTKASYNSNLTRKIIIMFIGVWDRCSRMGGGYGTFNRRGDCTYAWRFTWIELLEN